MSSVSGDATAAAIVDADHPDAIKGIARELAELCTHDAMLSPAEHPTLFQPQFICVERLQS
jgi:hypothetical protein